MEIKEVLYSHDIEQGDLILIDNGNSVVAERVKTKKVTKHDGTEIIYNNKENKYFSLTMYLDGQSWVKDLKVVRHD